MKRRIKALILALLLVVTTIWVDMPHVNASTTDNGVSVSETELHPGDTLTVTLAIPALTQGCTTLQGKVLFDKEAFQVTEIVAEQIGVIFMASNADDANNSGFFSFLTMSMGGTFSLENGYTMTATMTVKDGAKGNYKFEVDTKETFANNESTSLYTVEVATAEVNVTVPATAVVLNKTELSLVEGKSETLTAEITPANTTDAISWKSSDEAVATVDAAGKVTAVKPGKATITVTVGALSAACEVTVSCAHANVDTFDAKPSTCTEQGHAAYKYCNDCKTVIEGDNTLLPLAKHTLDHFERNEATCDVDGNIEYWKCSVCNQFFKDAEATVQIIEAETVIKATGHESTGTWEKDENNHWKPCGGCGVQYKFEEGAHVYGDKASDADYHWDVCTTCGYETVKVAHTGGAATCVKKAVCEVCGTEYGELSACNYVEVVKDAYLKSAATCTEAAVYYKSCSVCEKAHETETFVYGEALGHDFETTYTTSETEHWYACTRCDEVSGKEAHTGGSATCLEKATCTVCNAKYSDVGSHKYVEVVEETYLKSAATCTESAVYFKSCSVCKEAHASETFTSGEALGHDFAAKLTSDAEYHWYACSRCDEVDGKAAHAGGAATCIAKAKCEACGTEHGDFAAHAYVEDATDAKHLKEAATCTTKAVYYKSCSVCDVNGTETFEYGEVLGHDFAKELTSDAEYHWYACSRCDEVDGKAAHAGGAATCLAKAKCDACGTEYGDFVAHAYVEDATDAKHLKSEATCAAKAVYYKSCLVCDVNGTETFEYGEVNLENHVGETEIRDAKEAKCYEAGFTGNTHCKACGTKLADGEVIAKLPHSITSWVVTQEPTTEATGLKTGYCVNKDAGCTEEHQVVIAKLVADGSNVTTEVKGEDVAVDSAVIEGESNVNENVILQVENITDELSDKEQADIKEQAEKAGVITDKHEVLTVLDITMILRETTASGDIISDTEFELEGKVKIKIQIPDEFIEKYENIVLLHVKDDGSVEVIPYTLDANNVATFTAEDFSYYVLSGTEKETETTPGGSDKPGTTPDDDTEKPNKPEAPVTGDVNMVAPWVVVSVCALAVAAFVSRKQKRVF